MAKEKGEWGESWVCTVGIRYSINQDCLAPSAKIEQRLGGQAVSHMGMGREHSWQGMAGFRAPELMELKTWLLCLFSLKLVRVIIGSVESIIGYLQPGYLNIPPSLCVSEMEQALGPQDPNQEEAEVPEEEKGLYDTLWWSQTDCLMGHHFIGSITATTSEIFFSL